MRSEESSIGAVSRHHHPAGRACARRVVECRLDLNEARREITRLRLQIDHLEITRPARAPVGEPDRLAAPPTGRAAYAPDPLGTTPEPTATSPPPVPTEAGFVNRFHVTNLGTLLDMLA